MPSLKLSHRLAFVPTLAACAHARTALRLPLLCYACCAPRRPWSRRKDGPTASLSAQAQLAVNPSLTLILLQTLAHLLARQPFQLWEAVVAASRVRPWLTLASKLQDRSPPASRWVPVRQDQREPTLNQTNHHHQVVDFGPRVLVRVLTALLSSHVAEAPRGDAVGASTTGASTANKPSVGKSGDLSKEQRLRSTETATPSPAAADDATAPQPTVPLGERTPYPTTPSTPTPSLSPCEKACLELTPEPSWMDLQCDPFRAMMYGLAPAHPICCHAGVVIIMVMLLLMMIVLLCNGCRPAPRMHSTCRVGFDREALIDSCKLGCRDWSVVLLALFVCHRPTSA